MDAIEVRRVLPPAPAVLRPGLEPNATLADRHDLTGSVARFTIRPDDGVPPFEPGQYFALGLTVDGKPLLRPYSTASARGETSQLEFLIRLVPDGAFTTRLWALGVGDRLRIGRPKGLFTLRPDDPRTHLFIATGTGLAPFLSMVETLVREDAERAGRPGRTPAAAPRAIVVHGVAYVPELAYRDRLERLEALGVGVRYVPALSRPGHPANDGWTGLTGRIDAALGPVFEDHGIDPADTVAYLCGNPEMIAAAERTLTERGLAAEAIVSEHYWPMA